jgi:hypothetical protein
MDKDIHALVELIKSGALRHAVGAR